MASLADCLRLLAGVLALQSAQRSIRAAKPVAAEVATAPALACLTLLLVVDLMRYAGVGMGLGLQHCGKVQAYQHLHQRPCPAPSLRARQQSTCVGQVRGLYRKQDLRIVSRPHPDL